MPCFRRPAQGWVANETQPPIFLEKDVDLLRCVKKSLRAGARRSDHARHSGLQVSIVGLQPFAEAGGIVDYRVTKSFQQFRVDLIVVVSGWPPTC